MIPTIIIDRVQQSPVGLTDRSPGRVVQVVARAVRRAVVVGAAARDSGTLHSGEETKKETNCEAESTFCIVPK